MKLPRSKITLNNITNIVVNYWISLFTSLQAAIKSICFKKTP